MDNYIDNEETQAYGPALRENLATAFATPAQLKTFIAYLIGQQRRADEAVARALTTARGAREDLSKASERKAPELLAARKLLTGFHQHLRSKQALGEWAGKINKFYPGGLTAITASTARVLTAVRGVQAALAQDSSVPDGKVFARRFAACEIALDRSAKKAGTAVTRARAGLSEQSAEKKAWLRVYRGIALIAEGLLVMEDRPGALATVVPHLSVPGKRKGAAKTAPAKSTGDGAGARSGSSDGAATKSSDGATA